MNASQKNDCSEVTQILLDAGADINATDAQSKTALDHALALDNENILSVLRLRKSS
jgi:ankyrin repeat protein